MKKSLVVFEAALMLMSVARAAVPVSLAGEWRFALDRQGAGVPEKWFNRNLEGRIQLPGSLTEQGIGDDITTNTPWIGGIVDQSFFTSPEFAKYREPGNVKLPFWLQPDKYYAGAAWFQRDIEVPANWEGKRVVLFLERAHWETQLWVDGNPEGSNQSLSTPHEYDLGQLPPGKHTLTVRADNRMIVDIGENTHGISDHTQGNWNGIVGKIELRSTPPVWLDDVQIYPNAVKKSALVKVRVGNITGKAGRGILAIGKQTGPVSWNEQGGDASMEVALGEDAQLWDEFHPALQSLTITLQSPESDSRQITFGLCNISTDETQFLINGRKTFFRGTLECCIFPKTGHPPTNIEEWRRIIGIAKAHGLNHLRMHSYCPPEAAFRAADELGMYLQIETCWANQSTTIGDGNPVDQWVYEETDRILKAYGNHPSFVLMPYGNEPGGKNAAAYLAKYVAHFKALDPRRLWTSGAGWPQLAENQFQIAPDPRVQLWGAGLKSRINAKPPETTTDYRNYIEKRRVPVVSHEIGQWCVYPNFDEIPKYTGYLKPKNFEIFRDRLDANGMGNLAHEFLLASGKLQTLCYKEDIESALRTPGMGGFQLLDLHDFPGQGTALVGVLDPFWEEKGYVTADEYSRFCNETVPLARLKKRVFTTVETLDAQIDVAHFGAQPIRNAVVEWKILDGSNGVVAHGAFQPQTIPVGNGVALGDIMADLKNVQAPARIKLVVGIKNTRFENDWNLWVYPTAAPAPSDVLVTSVFDEAAQQRLAGGGKVLLTIPGNQVRNFDKDPVMMGFSSIFWNTSWTKRQAPTTLGILCDPENPALAAFPTEFHSDWQWWYLIHRAGALRLDLLPKTVDPVVRIIDDWVTARPLALVVEGKVGKGQIVICGFDLTQDATLDPVSHQMRRGLLDYMESSRFKPAANLSVENVRSLIVEPQPTSGEK